MQMSWPGEGSDSDRDPWGNILCSWIEKGQKHINKILLCPWGKPMDQVRAEAAAFPGNVLVPEGWLYVCIHCGSRRMDRNGLSVYSDEDMNEYIWEPECISHAVLVSQEEYDEGRRFYDAQNQNGQGQDRGGVGRDP